jgi:O-acetyl-ADP-ribose deacetylase (regulator of RNase III)
VRVVSGDLLEMAANGQFDVIVHGCNRQRTMGAGIAKQIKVRFPEAFDADLASPLGSAKLGTISYAVVQLARHQLVVVNGYTQATWRGAGVKVDYDALRSVMRHVKSNFSGKRIGYPKIGAGLAGGDWSVIEKIMDDELAEEDHALVEYKP